jgi:hypothetical protein
MIKINGGSKFLQTSTETMTSKKVENLVVNFQSSLVNELIEGVPTKVGKIDSWVFDEQGTNIMQVQKVQNLSDFDGVDILNALTNAYIVKLEFFNPAVSFSNTLMA